MIWLLIHWGVPQTPRPLITPSLLTNIWVSMEGDSRALATTIKETDLGLFNVTKYLERAISGQGSTGVVKSSWLRR